MSIQTLGDKALSRGSGVLRLAPAWVPRSFCRPGMRIKLHPADTYKLGLERGGIDERWLASATHAENGPLTPEDEGLSYVLTGDGPCEKILLRDLVAEYKGEIIGDGLYAKYGRWPMFSKFFDNLGPLPLHVHHGDRHAALVGQSSKPEMYFFPAQMNNYGGEFPFTFFGVNPRVTKAQVKECLENFARGDNAILDISRAYKLTLDTGWDVPPGTLHAPGTLCTYEPQFASDVYAMYQSVLYFAHAVPEALLWKDCPADKIGDCDYLVDVLDWELNADPFFAENRFMRPIPARDEHEMAEDGYLEEWICYKNRRVCAKRLTVLPGRTVTIKDRAAYGFILLQGKGKAGAWDIETPTLIRFGESTYDEFFVTENAAKAGVAISNTSRCEPLVMLKHFSENEEVSRFAV
ncbi:MAG: hypothetical protein FWC55_09315 [Firmicutes bacterium]|nr:hypothetical protein [Bacillota bacterium]